MQLLADLGAVTRRHVARYPDSALLREGNTAYLTDGSVSSGPGDYSVATYDASPYDDGGYGYGYDGSGGAAADAGAYWEPAVADDGTAYWYNTMTGESSWEPPAGYANPVDDSQWNLEV